jgi:hypothetical protein
MIEYFSKWLELVPLLDHSSEKETYVFLDRVLRFGVPTKFFIDQCIEFHGEFQELCEKTLIGHYTTSRNHYEIDKLVERMVHMVK